MANASIPIAKKDGAGVFTDIATIRFLSANTRLEIIDLDDQRHEFDIPETGLLGFAVSLALDEVSGGTNYFVAETESPGVETGWFELQESLILGLAFEGRQEPEGLFLKFIGEDEVDVMRSGAEHNLLQNAGFGFSRATASVTLKVFAPPK